MNKPVLASDYDLVVVSPVFCGSASGAAVYYQLLVEGLRAQGRKVLVISEATEDENADYIGLFPKRAGRGRRPILDYFAYFYQQILNFRVPDLIADANPPVLLVHSSFFNYPGTFGLAMRRLAKSAESLRLVADVRDQLAPKAGIAQIVRFDRIIACSLSVKRFLISNSIPSASLAHVPILQRKLEVERTTVSEVLAAFGVEKRQYVFFAGRLKESKGLANLLDLYQEMRKEYPRLLLVLAGLLKTTSISMRRRLQQSGIKLVGQQGRKEVLSLLAGASLAVNLSPSEGMPRFSLESIALGRPTLLPPGIPEFDLHCPAFVAASGDPRAVAKQAITIMKERRVPAYPVEKHYPENVLPLYDSLLFQ